MQTVIKEVEVQVQVEAGVGVGVPDGAGEEETTVMTTMMRMTPLLHPGTQAAADVAEELLLLSQEDVGAVLPLTHPGGHPLCQMSIMVSGFLLSLHVLS
jgi:hypothetical protein